MPGENTMEVLREYGLTDDETAQLLADEIIGVG